ncbi:MAG: hypothetical protein GF368_05275 [Candidatus Aenigmarchaeota archaeon]|nr:hypothetical protein [Candidatus Aenigmarchaeota archaeon]
MKSKHTYVVLIDLPEALPFELPMIKTDPTNIGELNQKTEKSEKALFKFIEKLEKEFGEEFSFIGEDVIGEKFYKRFLFPKGGFLEVMYQTPAALIAHFIEKDRAENFSKSLKKIIDKTVDEDKVKMILKNLVEVNTEEEDSLTYDKWTKLTKIRSMTLE